jgi:hypothetical protein
MWVEGQHERRNATTLSFGKGLAKDGLVAAMHAVEIADRHHSAAESGRQVRRVGDALET